MCEGAAYGGHLKVLKWARAKGCDWDNDKMCMIAAGGGQLEVMKWFRAQGSPWHERTCMTAAK